MSVSTLGLGLSLTVTVSVLDPPSVTTTTFSLDEGAIADDTEYSPMSTFGDTVRLREGLQCANKPWSGAETLFAAV